MARGSVRGRLLMKQIEKTLAKDERYVLLIIKAPQGADTPPHIEAVSDIMDTEVIALCLSKAAATIADVPEDEIHTYRGPRGGDLVEE